MKDTFTLGDPLIEQARSPIVSENRGDAANSRATNYRISIDERFEGTISSGDSGDWIAVSLTAGEDYVFTVGGRGGLSGLEDPTLTVYDSGGRQVAFNDDSEGASNLFPLVEYRATQTGTYYIKVDGYETSTGNYFLEVATDQFTVDDAVVQLAEFGWGIPIPIAHAEGPGDVLQVDYSDLTSEGRTLAQYAMGEWAKILGFTVQSVTSNADIVFSDSQSGAFGGPNSYFPSTGEIVEGFVNIGTDWLTTYGTTLDSYSYQTYLHEIGHALGLSHSGQYDGFATFGRDNHFANDTTQLTIMSYFDQDEIGASLAVPITPMIADIEAVRFLYDADGVAVEAGNTTWGANTNVGGAQGVVMRSFFDGVSSPLVQGENVAMTIVDTGGTDVFDLSTVDVAQRIDLAEEAISDVGGLIGNVVIARGTTIENVIGGTATDEIIGNTANNRLEGRNGDDSLVGGGGDDDLRGGAGTDRLVGDVDEAYGGTVGYQLYRLYQATLDRAPDTVGYMNWLDILQSGQMTALQVTNGFINSAEFQIVYGATSNEDFVTLLYRNVLDRAPDAGGLAGWLDFLNSGQLSRGEVVLGFADSPEFKIKTSVAAEGYDTAFGIADFMDEVFRLYLATFDRDPDLGGFEFHAERLASGVSLDEVASGFTGSREFELRYGTDTSNTEFVTLLYQNVLDRAPDAEGLNGWLNLLNSGRMDRGEVLTGFSDSAEFRITSADEFEAFMVSSSGGRGGDDRLEGGTGNDSLVGGVYSDEFVFRTGHGTDSLHDLEAWDQLTFAGFGFSSDADARAAMRQDDEDVVFAASGTTVRIENTRLSDITDDMIFVT